MSKPELLLADFKTAGVNNGDLGATVLRLDQAKAWKKQRIVMLIPAGKSIPAKVYLSHINMIFPPNNGVARIMAQDMEVGEAYSTAIENVLAHPELSKWEYILTVEHDNIIPQDGVLKLLESMEAHPEYACIGGLYFCKGIGGSAQLWGDPKDPILNFRPQVPNLNGELQECCGLGMGFNLFRMKMFKDKKLRRPWFKTQTEGGVATQDLFFWTDARKYGYRCAVDTRVKVGHYDASADFIW